MNKLTLRNVRIRYIDIRRKTESMPFVRLHLSADLSDTVAEEMGWSMPGDGQTDGSLAGRLAAQGMVLTPNDKTLALRELALDITEVSDFGYSTTKDDETGEIKAVELRFIVRSNQECAGAAVEAYWRAVGEADARMKLEYQKAPKQGVLEMQPAEAPEAKADDPDDFADAAQPGSPALASHSEMKRARRGVQ